MPAPSSRQITVSIVSHGQQALILPLLEQLSRFCADAIVKVVLTVNVPEKDLVDCNAYRFPVQTRVNARPRGFGANHNGAFTHCDSEWFLVLNPDIRIGADVLGGLKRLARPDAGLLTPRIVEPGNSTPEPHRGLLTPCEILVRRRAGYRAPTQPVWIPGMFMLFRAQAYRAIEGFDARYFMYGEDFDICARLRLAGWTIQAADALQVQHDAQRASQRNWKHLRWHFTSLFKVWSSCAFWRYRTALLRGRG